MRKFNNLSKVQKITVLFVCLITVMIFSISIPTFARFKNRVIIENKEWDGIVASSYKSGDGTQENPYIIETGSELAYFAKMLSTTTYKDKYFKLTKNIIINKGILEYKEGKFLYSKNNLTYFIKDNAYYADDTFQQESVGVLNLLPSLNNFEGNFDGNYFSICGLYQNQDIASLFTNLKGKISNLYIKNALLIGQSNASGIASKTNNAIIHNIMFDGYVISNGKTEKIEKNINIEPILTSNTLSEVNIPINIELPISATNVKYQLNGEYNLVPETNSIIKINDNLLSSNQFSINLEKTNNIKISVNSDNEATLNFSNVSLSVSYDYAISSGIVGESNNSTLTNIINKGKIYGSHLSSGLIGILSNSSLSNAYNEGLSTSVKYNSGIASIVLGNSNFNRVYNEQMENNMISTINNAVFKIDNSFNISNQKVINEIINSNVTINNSYVLDSSLDITNKFIVVTNDELLNGTLLTDKYADFISFNDLTINPDNIWITRENKYPKLYIDDIDNPYVKLKVNDYIYNNYSDTLSTLTFNNDIKINILKKDLIKNYKIYYYISSSSELLTIDELNGVNNFIEYTNEITITKDNNSIIYVKIVDGDKVSYINSDKLYLNHNLKVANIYLQNKIWNTYNNNPANYYLNDKNELSIKVFDELGIVNSLDYFLSDKVLTDEELNTILWIKYKNNIPINHNGKYLLYVKITDENNIVRYINSDYIIYDGYQSIMSSGKNNITKNHLHISNKSYINFQFKYDNLYNSQFVGNHSLISSILLPIGTEITLYDNITKKVYGYNIETSDDLYNYNNSCNNLSCRFATYDFSLFKEKGSNRSLQYIESSNPLIEDFKIKLDFSKTNIQNNIQNIGINLIKKNSDYQLNTLKKEYKYFNIYVNSSFNQFLNVEGIKDIIFNTNSDNSFKVVSGINYQNISNNEIIDTQNEDMQQGILLNLIDQNKEIVTDNSILKNMVFSVDNNDYAPDSNGLVIIPLSNNLNTITKTISIKTLVSNDKFLENNYSIRIKNFISYDGYIDRINNKNYYDIPLLVKNSKYDKTNYIFSVNLADSDKILNKNDSLIDANFKINVSGINNPIVKVSLYQKKELTAYNQDYLLVNLNDYINNKLENDGNNQFLVPLNSTQFNLNFINSQLEKNGYKLIFNLYDGETEVTSISQKFLVR